MEPEAETKKFQEMSKWGFSQSSQVLQRYMRTGKGILDLTTEGVSDRRWTEVVKMDVIFNWNTRLDPHSLLVPSKILENDIKKTEKIHRKSFNDEILEFGIQASS